MINNRKQTLLIRGQNVEQPILLCCHGGPGMAQIGFIRHFQKELEKHFIVINWDQRGQVNPFQRKILSKFYNRTIHFRCKRSDSICTEKVQ